MRTGKPLSTVYGMSRKGSVKGQEMRAPSSQHSDGKGVALLPAQDADGISGCSDPQSLCLLSLPYSSLFGSNNGNLFLMVLKAGSSRSKYHFFFFFF